MTVLLLRGKIFMTEKLSAKEFDLNLKSVTERLEKALERSGRKREDVILLAATKTVDAKTVNYAISKGISYIGENKVQDMVKKAENLPKDIRWHLIGHLQTNKVKYIVGKTYLVQSVDRIELAEEINVTRQNLSNKMNRDKFSALELVEIADALNMNLVLKDRETEQEFIIDYPDELKGKSKRNMTEEEKRIAQEKSMQTKARNAELKENHGN